MFHYTFGLIAWIVTLHGTIDFNDKRLVQYFPVARKLALVRSGINDTCLSALAPANYSAAPDQNRKYSETLFGNYRVVWKTFSLGLLLLYTLLCVCVCVYVYIKLYVYIYIRFIFKVVSN